MNEAMFQRILQIYQTFSFEKDYNILLETILQEIMTFTACDAGTLYIIEDNYLHFQIIRNVSMNIHRNFSKNKEPDPRFPPVKISNDSVCGFSALKKEIVNITDVYNSSFDFSSPKKYDQSTGYRTKSMLVLPLENDFGEVIGVIQLINAKGGEEIIPFASELESFVYFISTQAGLCLGNMQHERANQELLRSFVEMLSTGIDELSKFTANHSNNMVQLARGFLDWLTETNHELALSSKDKEQLLMSVQLHDIGKLTTPECILNKETRLGSQFNEVMLQIEKLSLCTRLALAENKMPQQKADEELRLLEECKELVASINFSGFLSDEMLDRLQFFAKKEFLTEKDETERIFTEVQLVQLETRRGTLTDAERKVMEHHVIVTSKMLHDIKFTANFQDVPFWAGSHHEFLDGSGYPKGLKGDEIPIPTRILTIIDIYEALVSRDRPYKKTMNQAQAMGILYNLAQENKLDRNLIQLFKLWQKESEVNP